MAAKTASGLVKYCEAQLGLPYWMGTYGQKATESLYKANKARLPAYYTASDFASQYGKRVHDCVGLIKGYRWSDTPTSTPAYNALQDVAVSGLLAQCSKKGEIASIPEQAGVCVFMNGHVGVYIGNGYVIEARGHAYGVVKTKLSSRPWVQWGKPDWLTYDTAIGETAKTEDKTITVSVKQLQQGSRGNAVKALQILLNGFGYNCGTADGVFGTKTLAALQKYQTAQGLSADGVCGPLTWAGLIG